MGNKQLFCFLNFKNEAAHVNSQVINEKVNPPALLFDHWQQKEHKVGKSGEYLVLGPYAFSMLETKKVS